MSETQSATDLLVPPPRQPPAIAQAVAAATRRRTVPDTTAATAPSLERGNDANSILPSSAPDPSTSVAKALSLLSSFTPRRPVMGVSEIARRARLPKSTAHRLLSVLVEWDLVAKQGTEYSPGSRLAELAAVADSQHYALRQVALPHLLDLYEATHETVNLCVLAGGEVLYLEKIHGHKGVDAPSYVGGRLAAASTAVGKALLAYSTQQVIARACTQLRPTTSWSITSPNQLSRELAEIRRTGIAYDRQETRPGLTCVAAPIRDWSGEAVAAISISGPVRRFLPATAVPAIRSAAAGAARAVQRSS